MLNNFIHFAHQLYDDANHKKHIYTYYSRTLSHSGYILDRNMKRKAVLKFLNAYKNYESVLIDYYTHEIVCNNEKIADFEVESVNSIKIYTLPGYFIYIKNKDDNYNVSHESTIDLHAHVALNVYNSRGHAENIPI